mgnify:FL=1
MFLEDVLEMLGVASVHLTSHIINKFKINEAVLKTLSSTHI